MATTRETGWGLEARAKPGYWAVGLSPRRVVPMLSFKRTIRNPRRSGALLCGAGVNGALGARLKDAYRVIRAAVTRAVYPSGGEASGPYGLGACRTGASAPPELTVGRVPQGPEGLWGTHDGRVGFPAGKTCPHTGQCGESAP